MLLTQKKCIVFKQIFQISETIKLKKNALITKKQNYTVYFCFLLVITAEVDFF